MSIDAIIVMILVLVIIWGGFGLLLSRALGGGKPPR